MHAKPLLVPDDGIYEKFREGYSAVFEQNLMFADPPASLAEFIQTTIETDQPFLRYQYGDIANETAKLKLVDPTGNATIEANSLTINYLLPPE